MAAVTAGVAGVAALTALLLPSVLDLVYAEIVLGTAALWPIVSEAHAVSVETENLRVRTRLRRSRAIPWASITEVVCRPAIERPKRIRILSGHGQVRLSERNPGLAAVLSAVELRAPAAVRSKGTWLRR